MVSEQPVDKRENAKKQAIARGKDNGLWQETAGIDQSSKKQFKNKTRVLPAVAPAIVHAFGRFLVVGFVRVVGIAEGDAPAGDHFRIGA